MNKTTLLITTAIVAAGLSAPSFAAKSHVTTASAKFSHQVLPKFAPGSKTVLSHSSFYGTVASGFSGTVASQSVTAKKGGDLAMSAFFQYCGFEGEYSNEATDIVTLVDGTYVDGGPFQQALSTTEDCVGDSWQGVYSVGAGTHTVVFEGYSLGGDALLYANAERTDVYQSQGLI